MTFVYIISITIIVFHFMSYFVCMWCRQVRVLYSTTLDKSKTASMTKIVKRLGGSVEDKEGPEFTHFVTLQPTSPGQTDRGFKKSINALIALAAGQQLPCFASAAVRCVGYCIRTIFTCLLLS